MTEALRCKWCGTDIGLNAYTSGAECFTCGALRKFLPGLADSVYRIAQNAVARVISAVDGAAPAPAPAEAPKTTVIPDVLSVGRIILAYGHPYFAEGKQYRVEYPGIVIMPAGTAWCVSLFIPTGINTVRVTEYSKVPDPGGSTWRWPKDRAAAESGWVEILGAMP